MTTKALGPTDTRETLFSTLYRIEDTVRIDLKRMAISILIFPILYLVMRLWIEDQPTLEWQSFIFFVMTFIGITAINGMIFFSSLKLKALGWVSWIVKWVMVALVLGFVVILEKSVVFLIDLKILYEWKLEVYASDFVYAFIFHGLLPYLFYRIITYFFPPKTI